MVSTRSRNRNQENDDESEISQEDGTVEMTDKELSAENKRNESEIRQLKEYIRVLEARSSTPEEEGRSTIVESIESDNPKVREESSEGEESVQLNEERVSESGNSRSKISKPKEARKRTVNLKLPRIDKEDQDLNNSLIQLITRIQSLRAEFTDTSLHNAVLLAIPMKAVEEMSLQSKINLSEVIGEINEHCNSTLALEDEFEYLNTARFERKTDRKWRTSFKLLQKGEKLQ